MNFEIYHQLGHNYVWNIDSITKDKAGDGIIVGPRNIEREKVEKLPKNLRRRAIFDPQFFLPSVARGKLSTYPFFPQIAADGFSTSDYGEDSAPVSAAACIDFQVSNGFRYLVVPTRYEAGMASDYIETQERLFVRPFLDAIATTATDRPVLLQLVLNDQMLTDSEYSADLINWATGFGGIAGVYLIVQSGSPFKQIKNADLLYRFLSMIAAFRMNSLEVVLGYLNTEALLLSLADPTIVTMGAYENTRSFQIRAFQETTGRQQGPNPRLYVSRALQWIDHGYHGAILRRHPEGVGFFDQNEYQALMFQPSFNWHFTKSELYKHHFLEFYRQLKQVADVGAGVKRYTVVTGMIQDAVREHDRLIELGVVLDGNNDGSHLSTWLTAANEFASDQGWL